MKTYIKEISLKLIRLFVIVSFICLSQFSIIAQTYSVPQKGVLLSHESIPRANSVTTIYSNVYQNIYNKEYNFPFIWSENKRHVEYETMWLNIEANFDDKDRLISYYAKSKEYPYPVQQDDRYEYDNQNRVVKISNDFCFYKAYYTDSPTDSVVRWDYDKLANSWYKTSKDEILYSNDYYDIAHYSFDNDVQKYTYHFTTRYHLDSTGRVVKSADIDSSAGSVFEFEYSDKGYSLFISYYNSEHPIFKYDVEFTDNGDLAHELYYEWMNGSYWKLCTQKFNIYDYFNAGIESVCQDNLFTISGRLLQINTDKPIVISTMSGLAIYAGSNRDGVIKLPSHTFCIIRIAEQSYKVYIQ